VAGISGQNCRVTTARAVRRYRQTVCATLMLSQLLMILYFNYGHLSEINMDGWIIHTSVKIATSVLLFLLF